MAEEPTHFEFVVAAPIPAHHELVSDCIDGEVDSSTARTSRTPSNLSELPSLYARLVEALADLKRLTTGGEVEKVVGEILAALPEGSYPPEQRGAQDAHKEGEV